METFLYFALLAGLFFFMKRAGCGTHAAGEHRESSTRTPSAGRPFLPAPPEKSIDPVCGETVRTATAKPSAIDGVIYYFCSRDCREIFETAPERYSGGGERNDELEASHA